MALPMRCTLAWLAGFLAVAGSSLAAHIVLPGEWPDQDKTHDVHVGWGTNAFDDSLIPNGRYDPGEAWAETVQPGWIHPVGPTNDNSCWTAAASNLVRYASGRDRYAAWVYDSDWPGGETWTWQDGGWPRHALVSEGYPEVHIGHNLPDTKWSFDPTFILEGWLAAGRPVVMNLRWPTMGHSVTVYGIDTAAQTLTYADNGNDLLGDYLTLGYEFVDQEFRVPSHAHAIVSGFSTFALHRWQGSGTGGLTDLAGPTTDWHEDANWLAGSVPGVMTLPWIAFSHPGQVNVSTAAKATRGIFQHEHTVVAIHPSGWLDLRSLQIDEAEVRLLGGTLEVHHDLSNDGHILMTSGTLRAHDTLRVGAVGLGLLTLDGGLVEAHTLHVGDRSGSSGTILMSDGTLRVLGDAFVGVVGKGVVDQTGGLVDIGAGRLDLGGTYTLGPGAELVCDETQVRGGFTSTGGLHRANALHIGRTSGGATYQMGAGAKLHVGDLHVGSILDAGDAPGAFVITDPTAEAIITGDLVLHPDATLSAPPGTMIWLRGSDVWNSSTTPTHLADLVNVDLVFEGGAAVLDRLEVGGRDLGISPAGLVDNFALGGLRVGGAHDVGRLQLVDLFDNQPGWTAAEVLYVGRLAIGEGSVLDLGGLSLFYGSYANHGGQVDFNGGTLAALTPEPASLAMLALGLGMLARRRRRWRAR